MKKIKIFLPHMEIRIHVTEQMEADLRECWCLAHTEKSKNCDACSWKETEIGDTAACEFDECYRQLGIYERRIP